MATALLKKNCEKRIELGHLWIFSNEIEKVIGSYSQGNIVEVLSFQKRFLGRGYINPHSLITIRLLTREREEIDFSFFRRRIEEALQYRKKILPQENSYRLIFGESDFLPGLIVDKYENVLVIQTLALGMEQRLEMISRALEEVLNPVAIYERNDNPLRSLEGLPERKGLLEGKIPSSLTISENGLKFEVDIVEGQKTGFYFDQRENRSALGPYAKGAKVLDCFCYTGGFSLYANYFGAKSVLGVDISEEAIGRAKRNAKLNGCEKESRFMVGDVFEVLKRLDSEGEFYDLVILDPPSFTRTKRSVKGALAGYQEINFRAIKVIRNGGYLFSFSCSHHIDETIFEGILVKAAARAKRKIRLLEFLTQAKDHPILLPMKETRYLKGAIVEAL